ncbi:uncharacterized protein V1516DRAFT_690671 [Lipomyces oligophaga]|uniref:uncharacterized protein n=1 Tax=Lipomyces oligophaga TaxID=45792 RepID=UPI0034CFDB92
MSDINNIFDDHSDADRSDDELSDLDEDQFKDIQVDSIGLPITEEVYKIQRHKRTGPTSSSSESKKKERKRVSKRSGTENDEERLVKKRTKKEKPEVVDSLDSLDPETRRLRELEERLDAAIKPQKKRKKVDEDDLEQMQDERIAQTRDKMRDAAFKDAEAIREGKPAIYKIKMLPDVREILQKHSLYDSILENNLLESVRLWLEPLPDASLPAYSIQREMFKALEELPIKTIHLRESGIGRVVLFYQKSRRPQVSIKHIAERLIADWSRPIISRKR